MTRAGRRSDLLKLPVLRTSTKCCACLARRRRLLGSLPVPELFHLLTVADTHIGALFTAYDARANREVWRIAYVVRDIPWHRVNVAQFRIDETHGNAFTAAGSRLSATPDSEALRHAMRLARYRGRRADPARNCGIPRRGPGIRDATQFRDPAAMDHAVRSGPPGLAAMDRPARGGRGRRVALDPERRALLLCLRARAQTGRVAAPRAVAAIAPRGDMDRCVTYSGSLTCTVFAP